MLQWSSVFYFLIRHWKNNLLFFFGNVMIVSLQYLFFMTRKDSFFLPQGIWLFIFLTLVAIQLVYQLVFYLRNSRRMGLLLLYGSGKIGLYLIVFFENFMTLILALLINLMAGEFPGAGTFFLFLALNAFCSAVAVSRYFFVDLYKLLKD